MAEGTQACLSWDAEEWTEQETVKGQWEDEETAGPRGRRGWREMGGTAALQGGDRREARGGQSRRARRKARARGDPVPWWTTQRSSPAPHRPAAAQETQRKGGGEDPGEKALSPSMGSRRFGPPGDPESTPKARHADSPLPS